MALPIFIGEKMAKHILSCSFGKDSIATALLALQHGEPLDELVYCEVMFSEEISGELPEHNRFIHETAIPYFEQRGIPTRVLRSEKTYLTHLNRCKAMDSYHRALIYILTAVPALRNNIDACFNFEKDEIKPESLAAGWQTSGTTKLTRFAYNLWNGYDDKSCTPYDLFDCSFAPYMYEAVKLRYPEYTRQLDDVVIDDARN